MRDQNLLEDDTHRNKFISILPRAMQEEMRRSFAKAQSGLERWEAYCKAVDQITDKKDLTRQKLVFTYLYPRLDANVSKGLNHLLKSPFCIHPKTGNVCVPFDPAQVEVFDVNQCPTLNQVIKEMGE